MKTGVCYYPEHWPESRWADDAAHMRRLGLSVVRIGEFAWSRLESANGDLHFDWLKRAIDTLHAAGLEVVLGTPTATPPRWIIDRHPDMLAVDEHGRTREFGSRRHYCFSSRDYREECVRIVSLLAEAFGNHPGVTAWQTDNEYGCHSTTLSYSNNALLAFREWCSSRYGDIQSLNEAWGNVFWSMEYDTFEQIGLPTGTVTENNPAHRLAFWRFSSDQVVSFNRLQTEIIRPLSPGRDLIHNFMGNFVEFDHHAVSKDLDVAGWDNYPLGFLTRDGSLGDTSEGIDYQSRYLRTGHPDGSGFHHDLYRGCCDGRWWLIEQQPGPVNWAPHNPAPRPGMVRLWGWEAFAHGAELCSWFRWRQAPFAQEQMHTGLLLSSGEEDVGAREAALLAEELKLVGIDDASMQASRVAIIFDYDGNAMADLQQPDGETYNSLQFSQRVHSACRRLGLDVDIIASDADLSAYALLFLVNSIRDDAAMATALKSVTATVVLFPRSGSKSDDYCIPDALPPGHLQELINVRVVRCETLPASENVLATSVEPSAGDFNSLPQSWQCRQWRECINSPLVPAAHFDDGWGFHYREGQYHYINAIPDQISLVSLIEGFCRESDLNTVDLGTDLRTRQRGNIRLAFNYGPDVVSLDQQMGGSFGLDEQTPLLFGSRMLESAGVAAWRVS